MKSGTKIVRLFSRLNIGGPAIHVVNLSEGLNQYGYETKLVVGEPDPTEGNLETWARERVRDVVMIPTFQAPLSLYKDSVTFFKLLSLFWTERPAIVHTHTFKAGLLGRAAAWLMGVPIIVHTYHGHLLNGYWGRLGTRLIKLIELGLSYLTTRLIAVSPKVANDLISAGVCAKEKIQVIELGFDVDNLKKQSEFPSSLRTDLNLPADSIVVGIVGRLVPVKGVDLFLRSLSPLLRDWANLHLVILGDGTEAGALKELAETLASDRIHFCGWRVPVVPDLKDLDLCVCSSKNEGTSVSIIEAIIARVPVISTHVGGMPDLLENGRWGTLVNFSEIELRASVQDFLKIKTQPERESEWKALQERALEASEAFASRFSSQRLVRETHELYEALLAEQQDFSTLAAKSVNS